MSVKIYEITKPRRLWQVYYVHQGKRIRKHFPSIEQAEAYRREIAAVINLGGTGALHLDVSHCEPPLVLLKIPGRNRGNRRDHYPLV